MLHLHVGQSEVQDLFNGPIKTGYRIVLDYSNQLYPNKRNWSMLIRVTAVSLFRFAQDGQ